jgi:hypothetical protein
MKTAYSFQDCQPFVILINILRFQPQIKLFVLDIEVRTIPYFCRVSCYSFIKICVNG